MLKEIYHIFVLTFLDYWVAGGYIWTDEVSPRTLDGIIRVAYDPCLFNLGLTSEMMLYETSEGVSQRLH